MDAKQEIQPVQKPLLADEDLETWRNEGQVVFNLYLHL